MFTNKIPTTITEEMQACITQCQTCHNICLESAIQCLEIGGEHAMPEHIRLLLDCAQICQTSADFMLRSSDLHTRTCAICSEVCDICAESCDHFTDPLMQRCAETCRTCARTCYAMVVSS